MSIFKKIAALAGGGITEVVGKIAGVVETWLPGAEAKEQFKQNRRDFDLAIASLIEARDSEIEQSLRKELEAKERVLIAELQQGDNFTKRARPTIAYSGVVFAFIEVGVRVAMIFTGDALPEGMTTIVPTWFYGSWAGVTGTWVIGRSAERRGAQNKIVQMITGNHQPKTGGVLSDLADGA